jgi:hypothetical protein
MCAMKCTEARRTLYEEDYKQGTKAVKIYECNGQINNRWELHDEACPATDVCISFNFGILETIKGIL